MRAFKEDRNCLETPTEHEKEYEKEERGNELKREGEKILDDIMSHTNSNSFSAMQFVISLIAMLISEKI